MQYGTNKLFSIATARVSTSSAGSLRRAAAGALTTLMALASLLSAHAAPTPDTTSTPWSWAQFKQSYGASATTGSYGHANPGVSTKIPGTALAFDYLNLAGASTTQTYAYDDGTELRGFILGDYGNAEPPTGSNNFLDSEDTTNIGNVFAAGANGIGTWISPNYFLSASFNGSSSNYKFDDLPANDSPTTVTSTFAPAGLPTQAAANATGGEYSVVAAAATDTTNLVWTMSVPQDGTYSVAANIPTNTGGETRITDATYTVTVSNGGNIFYQYTSKIDQSQTGLAYIAQSVTLVAADVVTVTLQNSTGNTLASNSEVVADSIQFGPIQSVYVDNTDSAGVVTTTSNSSFSTYVGTIAGTPAGAVPQPTQALGNSGVWNIDKTDIDYFGSDYLSIPAVKRAPAVIDHYAYWESLIATPGTYNLSVWLPSENTGTDSGQGTRFTRDIHVDDAEYTINFYYPATSFSVAAAHAPTYSITVNQSQVNGGGFQQIGGSFAIPANTLIQVVLDNTTADTITPANGANEGSVVVADAMEITPAEGYVSGSPVAINVTDYPEMATGYANAQGYGGAAAGYINPYVGTTTYAPAGALYSFNSSLPQVYGTIANAPPNIPLSQIVYYPRVENQQTTTIASPGLATQSGAMYAVDGRDGYVIWKFGSDSLIIDDSDSNFVTTGFTSITAPDASFYGTGYHVANAVSSTGAATATATWTLPILSSSANGSYDVYVWIPKYGTGDVHVNDAEYTVMSVDPNSGNNVKSIVHLDQTQNEGGWQLLPSAAANHAFIFGIANGNVASKTVVLDNLSASPTYNGGASTKTVIADAMMFVPTGSPGAIAGTPVVVRNMNVLTDPATNTYDARTVVIFADNNGKVFCVDAAGNEDGDNTVLDANGQPVSFDGNGNPIDPNTGLTTTSYVAPYHIKNYGTTHVYWIWQPDPSNAGLVPYRNNVDGTPLLPNKLVTTTQGTPDTTETDIDAGRDMPAPYGFQMASPTVALAPSTGNTPGTAVRYNATIFIGNPNGYLYALDGRGVLDPLGAAGTGNNANATRRYSLDPTTPTINVNWWFNTGAAIAQAPAYDTLNSKVYVGTYDPTGDIHGRLYSVDAANGPYGNGGLGLQKPQSYNYNVNPVSYWSFPDAWGTIAKTTIPAADHVNIQTNPALPLGDMAGSPAIEDIDGSGAEHILVCANDPSAPGTAVGSALNGHIYSVNTDGSCNWGFPHLGGDPNTINILNPSQYNTVFPAIGTRGAPTFAVGAFTQQLTDLGYFVSSSLASGIITFPSAIPDQANFKTPGGASLADTQVPMAYVGTLDGYIWALNLSSGIAGSNDNLRLIYAEPTRDGSGVYSAPALVPGSAHIGGTSTAPAPNGSAEVGGVLFFTTSGDTMDELEAVPYVYNNSVYVNYDFSVANVGGISSPATAGFDVAEFSGIQGSAVASKGNAEWVYCGSDDGFCYGFTPATSSGGGYNSFGPLYTANMAPEGDNVSLSNSGLVITLAPLHSSITATPNPSTAIAPPNEAAFEYGQKILIQVWGVHPFNSSSYPRGSNLKITLKSGNKSITGAVVVYQSGNTALSALSPVTTPIAGALTNYVYTVLVDTNNILQNYTPLPGKVTISAQEQGSQSQNARGNGIIATSQVSTGNLVRNSGAIQQVSPSNPETFRLLNPLAITGAGRSVDGASMQTIGELGPLGGITDPMNDNWTQWNGASENGNAVLMSKPYGGWYGNTTSTGTPPPRINSTLLSLNGGVAGATEATQTLDLSVGLGEIAHGSAGDSSTGIAGDPPSSNDANATSDTAGTSVTTAHYGSSLLNVTDRSALGSRNSTLGGVAMKASDGFQWMDNSGGSGEGAIINQLSWDVAPTSKASGIDNTSPDYPDIGRNQLAATLKQRIAASTNTSPQDILGSYGDIIRSDQFLAPCDNAGGEADPNGTRNVFPMPLLLQVGVPRFQPANLEAYQVNTGAGSLVQTINPGTLVTHTGAVGNNIPDGYSTTVDVYQDKGGQDKSSNNFNASKSIYRYVNVMLGVPVDMSIATQTQVADVGNVPAGFGDNVSYNNGADALPFSPYMPGSNNIDPANATVSPYAPYFQPLTIINNGNVNLLDVLMDQRLAGADVTGAGATLPSYLRLNSDQTEPSSFSPIDPTNWGRVDSLSYLPSLDNGSSLLGLYDKTNNTHAYVIRSSIDPDLYNRNPNEAELQGTLYNSTIHKPRVGDANGTTMSVPDQPHGISPGYESEPAAGFPYSGKPVVSVAVPPGTPAGTYYGTIRAFENSDSYDTGDVAPGNYSSNVTGPTYKNALAGITSLFIHGGAPEQFYAEPGTTLKVTVTENQVTDGSPISYGGYPLSLGGAVPASTNTDTPPKSINGANDLQPFVYRNWKGNHEFGMLFISNRDAALTNSTPGLGTYDLFTSAMDPKLGTGQSQLSLPSGAKTGTWWTEAFNATKGQGLGVIRSPYVLNDGTNLMAFFATAQLGAASGQPNYVIWEADVSTSDSGMTLSNEHEIAATPDPVFSIHAVAMQDNGGSSDLIVFWHTRVHGQAVIRYSAVVITPATGTSPTITLSALPTSATATANSPLPIMTLPVTNSVVGAADPMPELRMIAAPTSGNWGDATGSIQNLMVTPTNANYLDVTYDGADKVTGNTDLFVSRYTLQAKSAANGNQITLLRSPLISQQGLGAGQFNPEIVTLYRSNSNTALFEGKDIDWYIDPADIEVDYYDAASPSTPTHIVSPGQASNGVLEHYRYDTASGQIVYSNVPLPWTATGTGTTGNSTVYINPATGTVRFSTPPPQSFATNGSAIVASVIPLTRRITYNSRANTQPVAFMDDALKVNAAGTSIAGIVQPPHAGRQWYVYRKSGTNTGATASVNSTLYYDTQRLTMDLSALNSTTTSIHMVPNAAGNGTTLDTSGPLTVYVGTDSNMDNKAPVTDLVDIDAARGRIYFPSYMEGLYAQVTYVNQASQTLTAPVSAAGSNVGYQLTWQDEPYVNAQNPGQSVIGERTVPMVNEVNESDPCAFLDPLSGLQTVSGSSYIIPHRVWLFWSSTRNAAKTTGTGADIYSESLDPRFSIQNVSQ